MIYNSKFNKERLERFKVESLNDLKASLEQRPELKTQLEQDFAGTILAEGIVIDDAFKQEVHQKWRLMIDEDVRKVMDKQPEAKRPYYTMVREGKPLKVKVKIDRTTGKKSTTPEVKK
ncbi:MAG TPA: hypothetical protein C5S51_01285 [Methanosarcinaceae archaeon]|nr:hypothetical protein [Methanosarcinaceae archaeon]